MAIFTVTTTVNARADKPVYFPFDAPNCHSLSDWDSEMIEFGRVHGYRLRVDDRGTEYIELERNEMILYEHGVRWVQPMSSKRVLHP